ncbi:MAG: Na/Pi symporter [Alphaproteobacteria bacterium]|nr:Na/Pi symporter [Alphaproteobacteria bacterium]
MFSVLASFLAGLGLFFVGLDLLTQHLRMLSGRGLREKLSTWTKNPFLGVLWGGIFITITQSTLAVTFILISMLRSGMISVAQSLPIIIGINVLAPITALVLALDIKLAVLFLLGIAGITYRSERVPKLRTVAGALVGAAMLFFGLETIQEGVAPLAQEPWFEEMLTSSKGFFLAAFAVGIVLAVIIQSTLAVVLLTMSFHQAGLVPLADAIMIVYGANVGSSALTLVLSTALTGQSKQLAIFQTAYNFFGAIILVPAFYLEMAGHISLVKAATEFISNEPDIRVAVAYLLFNIAPGIFLFVLRRPIATLLQRVWPETKEEQASKPKYLHEHAADDPDSLLDLIELEQVRLADFLDDSFTLMRGTGAPSRLAAMQESFRSLSGTIREAISDVLARHQLSPEAYDRLNGLLSLQHSLETANDVVGHLGSDLMALKRSPFGARFAGVAVEGLDAILLTLVDVAKERSKEDARLLDMMTSEDGNGMAAVRSAYLAEESELDTDGRMKLLAASNSCERLIWLFGRMGRDYMSLRA